MLAIRSTSSAPAKVRAIRRALSSALASTCLRESHGHRPLLPAMPALNGSTSTPSRVFKTKRLPGHMGVVRVTVQNLSVVKVDAENNLIAIKGAIPGQRRRFASVTAVKSVCRRENTMAKFMSLI